MAQTRVNILTAINAASVTVEKTTLNGEQYTAIKNVKWHIDDIVLNGGLYPAEENAKSYQTMDGRLMPFGHPQVDGQYIAISNLNSAEAAVALGKHYGGVHATNVRAANGEYFADVMINERQAAAHEDGVKLLAWADSVANGESPDPVHMSTGLMVNRVKQSGISRGKRYSWVATNQAYDHLAILFSEQGAGGDEISLAVNCDEVINSVLDDSYGEQMAEIEVAAKEKYSAGDKWVFVMDFDSERAIISTDDRRFAVRYTREDGKVVLGEELGDVEAKTEFELKQNSLLTRVLNYFRKTPKTVEEIDDMTPEELQSALNAQSEKLQATFNEALAAQKAEFEKVLGEVTAQVNAKADAEAAAKRAVVAKELGDVVANALQGEALDAAFAKYQQAAPLVANHEQQPAAAPAAAEYFN